MIASICLAYYVYWQNLLQLLNLKNPRNKSITLFQQKRIAAHICARQFFSRSSTNRCNSHLCFSIQTTYRLPSDQSGMAILHGDAGLAFSVGLKDPHWAKVSGIPGQVYRIPPPSDRSYREGSLQFFHTVPGEKAPKGWTVRNRWYAGHGLTSPRQRF